MKRFQIFGQCLIMIALYEFCYATRDQCVRFKKGLSIIPNPLNMNTQSNSIEFCKIADKDAYMFWDIDTSYYEFNFSDVDVTTMYDTDVHFTAKLTTGEYVEIIGVVKTRPFLDNFLITINRDPLTQYEELSYQIEVLRQYWLGKGYRPTKLSKSATVFIKSIDDGTKRFHIKVPGENPNFRLIFASGTFSLSEVTNHFVCLCIEHVSGRVFILTFENEHNANQFLIEARQYTLADKECKFPNEILDDYSSLI